MAKEVIVNDGGAPARILPFVSAATGSAGDPIVIDTAGKTAALTADFKVAGFLLTDVDAVGDMASVVMGTGCILNVKCKSDVTVGEILSAGTARLDGVANDATQGGLNDGVEIVGIALEAGDAATDLPIKVLVL
jgi:hypothetical protein